MLRWHHARESNIRFTGELAVSVLSHPSSAGEMAAMHAIGAFRLLTWIDPKQDRDGFAPVCPIDLGVEQAEIQLHVGAIVVCQRRALRGLVEKCQVCQFGPRRSKRIACNGLLTLRTLAAGARAARCARSQALQSCAASASAVGALRADKHHSFALVGRQEDDAAGF